jgi:hypothetical protein
MLGRMADARQGPLLLRALLCAVLLLGTVAACNQSSDGQQVDLVAGGGKGDSDSGPAASLRLPAKITALTTAPDGTVWLAGRQDDESQLLSVTPDGQAHRTRLPVPSPILTSLAVRADGTVFAASGAKAIWRVAGDRLAVAYGKRTTGDLGQDLALFPPFVSDGKPVTSGNLGRVRSVGIDSSGRLLFAESIDELCYRVRRIEAAGTVSTLAGRPCPDTPDLADGRFPAAGTLAKDLPLAASSAAFTVGPANRLYVMTGPSVVEVDSAGKATVVLGSNGQNAGQVPDPAGASPFDKWTPAASAEFQAADADNAMSIAASAAGPLATVGGLDRSDVPGTFKWRAEAGDTHLDVNVPDQAKSGIAVLRDGKVATASLIGGKVGFRGGLLLVAASRDDGGVLVGIPLPG